MTSTPYQGRHWSTNVKNEPSLFWLFLTTFIPSYIYDLQQNRNNFRAKYGYLPLVVIILVGVAIVGANISWQDLMIFLALKKLNGN